MKKYKNIMAISLATCLALSPFAISATNVLAEENKAVNINSEVEEIIKEYTQYKGQITEVRNTEGRISILVKEDVEDQYSGEVLHLNEKVIILNNKTKDFMDIEDLEEGMTITRYTHKNTPVAQSLPPQLTPNVVVVNENQEEGAGSIHVDKFDKDLVSSDNKLKILLSEDTTIVNEENETVEYKDLENRDLIVFYTTSTKSIPAQTNAEKIILMDEAEKVEEPEDVEDNEEVEEIEDNEQLEELGKIEEFGKVVINEKELELDNPIYEKEDGNTMIPLRQISEALGYEVKWNNDSRTVELTKDTLWTSVKVGDNNYSFAKMLIKLDAAPEISDSKTYVPFEFWGEVLKLDVKVSSNGVISIVE